MNPVLRILPSVKEGSRSTNQWSENPGAGRANLEASGDERFLALANEMTMLCRDHFYDRATQTLAEYFDDSWRRAPGDRGRLIEPGHHFEWVWLLAGYQRLVGGNVKDLARSLLTFAEAHGVDPQSGATFNQISDDGSVLDRSSRTWPNTERIQVWVAMFELEGRDPRPVFEQSGRLLLERYLSREPPGTWIDQFGADGTPQAHAIPASTLYRVFIAFAEMARIEAAVQRAFAH